MAGAGRRATSGRARGASGEIPPWGRPTLRPAIEGKEIRAPSLHDARRTLLSALTMTKIGGFDSGGFEAGAAEISAYDPATQRLFVVNAQASTIDILNLADPTHVTRSGTIDVSPLGSPNSVDVSRNVVAVAVQNHDVQQPGKVAFYKTNGKFLGAVTTGALPDMVTFTPDGRYVLTANEGEPRPDYTVDPEGSVGIVRVPVGLGNVKDLSDSDSRVAGFGAFNGDRAALLAAGVRVYGPGATVAQDFEPEYVAVSADSRTAYVTLQENNAYAVVDIETATVTAIVPFGYKDHRLPGNGFDASDRDNAVRIQNWPVFGMYQPDSIKSYTAGGQTYLIIANEGDTRAYTAFNEEARVSTLALDPTAFPDAATLKANTNLGRLTVTNTKGDTDGDGDFDQLYLFGGRSFSVFTTDGHLVFDSGGQFEQITAAAFPTKFNAGNTNNTFDDRSDNKGPEPEGLTTGVVDGKTYAFIGLERIGGVMAYDITNPLAPTFAGYVNTRDFAADVQTPEAGDLGPEGVLFIAAEDSPNGRPLVVTSNEISGTVAIFQVGAAPVPATGGVVVPPPSASIFADGTADRIAEELLRGEASGI
jgi:2',3'-cyclic-nucleotide 2'-phosphodiesterase/3'-nucleotidase/5'-nucleotidase